MAGGADMRGGPQQRPPALQHVRGCEEGYEAGLSVMRTGVEQASITTADGYGSVDYEPDGKARRRRPCPRPVGHPGIGIQHPLGTV